jgi:hypothetical protein
MMKKTLTFILLIATLIACQRQTKTDNSDFKDDKKENKQLTKQEKEKDSLLTDFSVKWKADSLGQNGFRMNHYSFDSSTRTWCINGTTLKGYNKGKIINLLGKPKSSGLAKEDKLLIMVYIVRQKGKTPEKNLILYFDKKNNLDDIVEETGI